ncbi:MAG: hypothetical protein ACTSO8_05010 [Promethearchaeota archaeon]
MEKRNKYILLAFLGISCFTLLFFFNSILLHNPQSPFVQNEEERAVRQYSVDNITLIIDYSGVKTNEEFVNISLTNDKTTVYHLLLNCCVITIQDFGWGIYIQEINSVGPGWIYTVNNGAPPSMPSDYFNLLNNDTVKWKHV